MSHPELGFFSSLCGKLEIELDVPAQPVGNLLNLRAAPATRVVRLALRAQVFNRDTKAFRALTPQELDAVAFRGSARIVEHRAFRQ